MTKFAQNPLTNRHSTRYVRVYVGTLALLLVLNQIVTVSAFADGQQHTDESNAIRRMNEEIQELQAKVKELEARLNDFKEGAKGGRPRATVESSRSSHSEATPPLTPSLAVHESPENTSVAPSVKLRMFGDVGYDVTDQKGDTNSFHIGTLSLLMTGAVSDRLSVLGEVLFFSRKGNTLDTDVERLLLRYKHSDYLNFAVGRYHSSIGY